MGHAPVGEFKHNAAPSATSDGDASGIDCGESLGAVLVARTGGAVTDSDVVADSDDGPGCESGDGGPTIARTFGYRAMLNPIENTISTSPPRAAAILGIIQSPGFARRNGSTESIHAENAGARKMGEMTNVE